MKVIISKKNNHDNIVEFEDVFGKPEIQWVREEIRGVVDEFENYVNTNGLKLENYVAQQIEDVLYLKEGLYSFDCGDYTYYIKIEGGLKMISLTTFIDSFMDSKYLDEYLELEMKKHRDDKGNLRNWSAGRVINIQEQLQNYLVEIYNSIIGENLDEEKAEEIYESIIEEKNFEIEELERYKEEDLRIHSKSSFQPPKKNIKEDNKK